MCIKKRCVFVLGNSYCYYSAPHITRPLPVFVYVLSVCKTAQTDFQCVRFLLLLLMQLVTMAKPANRVFAFIINAVFFSKFMAIPIWIPVHPAFQVPAVCGILTLVGVWGPWVKLIQIILSLIQIILHLFTNRFYVLLRVKKV